MDIRWTQGLKGEEKEKRIKEVLAYRLAFRDLKEILEDTLKKRECVRDYENPNWVHRQIAVNEYNQVLEDVLRLINLEETQ